MLFELKLAFKYFRARRQSLARFTAFVAVAGVAAGVAALIVAQALANGFSREMRDKILANSAHVSVYSADGAEISDWREMCEILAKTENVAAITPTTYENAVLNAAGATDYVILRAENRDYKTAAENRVETWNYELRKVSVGAQLAKKSNLKIGDEAEIITLEADGSPRQTPVRIGEITETGIYEYDLTRVSAAPKDFARIKGKSEFTPQMLNVSVKDIYQSAETAHAIKEKIGENFRVLDWQEANRPLFAALSLERKVAFAIISLIVLLAALNITTTLALLVSERRLDIAVLRTCGARTRSLMLIFLLEGFFLGLIGTITGVIVGLTACAAGNYFKIISLSAEVYSISSVPLVPEFQNVLSVAAAALLICLTATIYPAWRASRVKPLENLRNQ